VRVLRYNAHRLDDEADLLRAAARDPHGRVRMEAVAAASWLGPEAGLPVVEEAGRGPMDDWLQPVHEAALAFLSGRKVEVEPVAVPETALTGRHRELFLKGAEVYAREGHCITCHQADGRGLPAAQFPPIAGTRWVNGNEERLIRLTLHGLLGPIEVEGQSYPGLVPMTPFRGLGDEEIAAVLTYVRNSFGNEAPPVTPESVRKVREATAGQTGFCQPGELMEMFPDE
jgi:mono/diheme cytochrome c family protein